MHGNAPSFIYRNLKWKTFYQSSQLNFFNFQKEDYNYVHGNVQQTYIEDVNCSSIPEPRVPQGRIYSCIFRESRGLDATSGLCLGLVCMCHRRRRAPQATRRPQKSRHGEQDQSCWKLLPHPLVKHQNYGGKPGHT